MVRKRFAILLTDEERITLQSVADIFEISMGKFIRLAALKDAKRFLKSNRNRKKKQ